MLSSLTLPIPTAAPRSNFTVPGMQMPGLFIPFLHFTNCEVFIMQPAVAIVLVLLALTNLFSFFLMWYDKRCARKGKWRVPEKTLFIACACFGGIGGVLGMNVLRHKTKHWYFKWFFPLMLIVQIVLLALGAVYLL